MVLTQNSSFSSLQPWFLYYKPGFGLEIVIYYNPGVVTEIVIFFTTNRVLTKTSSFSLLQTRVYPETVIFFGTNP